MHNMGQATTDQLQLISYHCWTWSFSMAKMVLATSSTTTISKTLGSNFIDASDCTVLSDGKRHCWKGQILYSSFQLLISHAQTWFSLKVLFWGVLLTVQHRWLCSHNVVHMPEKLWCWSAFWIVSQSSLDEGRIELSTDMRKGRPHDLQIILSQMQPFVVKRPEDSHIFLSVLSET